MLLTALQICCLQQFIPINQMAAFEFQSLAGSRRALDWMGAAGETSILPRWAQQWQACLTAWYVAN